MAKPTRAHKLIRIKEPDGTTRVEDLLRETYTLGRGDPDGKLYVDFVVAEDEHLSRQHCRFIRTEGTYAVENLGANGSVLNGKAIDKMVALKHKDKLEIGGGTTVEFLALSDQERTKELAAGTAATVETKEKGRSEEKSKSLLQSRWLWVIGGFYAVLGLVLMTALSDKEVKETDPGEGKFFTYLIEEPLEPSPSTDQGRRIAQRMWEATQREHGGELVIEGTHAYYLIERARVALGLIGYRTFKEALARDDAIAVDAQAAYDALEARILEHYKLAKMYLNSRHYGPARIQFVAIQEAIPDERAQVRKYATYMAAQLRQSN